MKIGLTLFAFIGILNLALSQKLTFRHLTNEDGLSNGTIRCMMKDSHGYVWLGTQDGLNRYDGYNFEVFRHDGERENSVVGNIIESIQEDQDGIIWIGTLNSGICSYNWETGEFTSYRHNENDPKSLPNNTIRGLVIDSTDQVWISSQYGGLSRYDRKNDQFIRYPLYQDNSNSANPYQCSKLLVDGTDRLIISTFSGDIFFLDINTEVIEEINYYGNNTKSTARISELFRDSVGNLWIGTEEDGVYIYNEKQSTYRHIIPEPNGNGTNANITMAFREVSDGKIWLGTDGGGINIYDPVTDKFTYHVHNPEDEGSISNNAVFCFFEDEDRLVWTGTFATGLNIYNPNGTKFKGYNHKISELNSLSHNAVVSLHEGKDKKIWIGTDGGGVNSFDPLTEEFIRYEHNIEDSYGINSNVIESVYEESPTKLWLGTFVGGLNLLNPETGNAKHYLPSSTISGSIISDKVWGIDGDSKGNIWIGNISGGISRINQENETFDYFPYPDMENRVHACGLVVDSKDRVWLPTFADGLFMYNPSIDKHYRFQHNPKDSTTISYDDIKMVYEDDQNNIWVGTSGGLNLFDEKKLSFSKPKINQLLPSIVVNTITQDKSGNYWIGTDVGLSKYYPDRHYVENYDKQDGLMANEITYSASLKASDGKIYVGTLLGFNVFDPNKIYKDEYQPELIITNFKLFDKKVRFGESVNERAILDQNFPFLNELTLTHKENIFSVEFASLDFAAPERIKYRYILEGFADEWTYTDAQNREATYMNLSSGDYLLRIQGTNSEGIWSKYEKTLSITILPPWWATWWFRSVTLLFIILILYFIYLQRTKSYKNQREKLEKAVEDRTADLKKVVEFLKVNSVEINKSGDNLKVRSGSLAKDAEKQSETAKYIENDIENVTNHTKKNSENAHYTNQLSSETAEQAEKIQKATELNIRVIKAIANKMNIIEDIFRQTNMLAINASIEAAKAGETGGGFGIIAAEVRKLAERSREASTEILESAKMGVKETEEVAQQILDFIPKIEKSAELVNEISNSSLEQASSIENVNKSLKDFFNSSQQNGVTSQEIFEISKELDHLAKQLNDQVQDLNV